MLYRIIPTVVALAVLLLIPGAGGVRGIAQSAPDSPANRHVDAAFAASHNLDFEQALGYARQAVRLEPENSRTHRGLASIIWLDLLFWRGGMTVDSYLGNLSSMQLKLDKPDPQLAEEFKGALDRAIELAEKRLRQKSSDVDAMYDAGAAYGVQASYMASVEGSISGAFKHARRAFDLQSEVLKRDPKRASAGLVVGTYRYIIATQPLVVQWFAYLAGFAGDRAKAIALLENASHDPASRVDGKTALVLIYSREGRHAEAMRLAGELAAELPRNRLFVLEQGSAAIRAGRAKEADAILTRGIAALEKDTRKKLQGERALWFYKRGLSRLNQNLPKDATADLREALASKPQNWVEGRTRVALGQVADLAGQRQAAIEEYTKAKLICSNLDHMCNNESRKYLRQPFSFEHR
jgi:tetratricopeptide (TPR) repeat protein